MHPPVRPGAFGPASILIIALLLLMAGCSGGDDQADADTEDTTDASLSDTQSDESTVETDVPAAPNGRTTSPVTIAPLPAVASEDAVDFKQVGPTLSELPESVRQFIRETEGIRIDQLATTACAGVSRTMTDDELGLQGIAIYEQLTERERQRLARNDWVPFYGTLVGFFCPEDLPNFDPTAPQLTGETDVERFRSILTTVDGVSQEAESFVAGLNDERVDQLQAEACRSATSDMTTDDFGVAIVSSYNNDLTDAERSAISLAGYSELFGAIIGWFCPENLPL